MANAKILRSIVRVTFARVTIVRVIFLISLTVTAGAAKAQLNESANASPFSVQGNNATIAQSGDQFSPERLQEYERQLNAVLKTRRDAEKQFLRDLVVQVGAGTVSTELVQTSFKWVRKKRPDTPFPFLYFERVLRILATQQGLAANIPPFNDSVIGQPNQANQDNSNPTTNQDAGILIR
jgi:hypothetical protein